jgi:hypothetical protein
MISFNEQENIRIIIVICKFQAIQRLHIPGGSKKILAAAKDKTTVARYKSLKISVAKPPVIREEGTTIEDVQNGTLYMSALEEL